MLHLTNPAYIKEMNHILYNDSFISNGYKKNRIINKLTGQHDLQILIK